MRRRQAWVIGTAAAVALTGVAVGGTATAATEAKATWTAAACYECHEPIQKLHEANQHGKVLCDQCHGGVDQHLADPGPETRPATDTSWEVCGRCHKPQYESFLKVAYHRPGRDEKSQLTGRAPNPFWDQLMMGHGFTKEHATTRSHSAMLLDHLVVDRAYGGRFQPRKGWEYLVEPAGKPVWDYLEDRFPDNTDQKAFLSQSAAAANPVCLQCKTQDQILDWAYLGDPKAGAKWSRASNTVEFVKSLSHGLNCFTCHDPHATKPRIVRDAMIEAFTKEGADTLWNQDPNRTKLEVVELGVRGYKRKIALLETYDSRLLCGQCHVEYNCGTGVDVKSGDKVTMADPRTNIFPYRDVFGLYDFYVNQVGFLDWKHPQSGALLWKAQHPESETYYRSVHATKGVQCDDCHTPKVTDPTTGETYTSHFAVTPRFQVKETCLRCHKEYTEEQAKYAIDSVKAYVRGKMRKAEFWLSALIDKIVEAKKAGVADDVVKQAQDQHLKAHILWEWWTAENSDGYHNPEMARESLTRSVDESQKGIKMVDDALGQMAKK